jgi:hypothetical protein
MPLVNILDGFDKEATEFTASQTLNLLATISMRRDRTVN